MIVLRWAPYPEADVASYRVCRSMIGFTALLADPADLDGKDLELKFNGGPSLIIVFSGTSSAIDQINAVIEGNGGKAFESQSDPANFIVRSDVRSAPGSVEIVGGSAMATLGLTARLIVEKSEEELVATVPALVDPNQVVTYNDLDGSPEDWYRLSTVDSQGTESIKTEYKQAITFTGAVCVIEGIVTDLQGARLPDVEVSAKIVQFSQSVQSPSQISTDVIKTITGPDGRFSLALLQGAVVQISIPRAAINKNITVPEEAFKFITDLRNETDYRYPVNSTC